MITKKISERKNSNQNKKIINKIMRFTENDINKIKNQMNKKGIKSFTEYATKCMLNKDLNYAINKELITALNRIGNNLNQVAKKLNAGDILDQFCITVISETFDLINKIYEKINNDS